MDTRQDRLVKRGVIIGMHQSGKPITGITFEMGLCRNKVSKWINRGKKQVIFVIYLEMDAHGKHPKKKTKQ